MAAAAQRTRRIRLGSAVVVLPFDNPLRAAEDYAIVDILSGGRLNLGTGSGYLKHEFEGFGIQIEEKRERFDEALEIVLTAWRGERFSSPRFGPTGRRASAPGGSRSCSSPTRAPRRSMRSPPG